jgi:hypothetical protein
MHLYDYVFNDRDATFWHKSYKDCLKNLESAETLNDTLRKKISELEYKLIKYEANQLYNTLCMQGKYDDARVVHELITRI